MVRMMRLLVLLMVGSHPAVSGSRVLPLGRVVLQRRVRAVCVQSALLRTRHGGWTGRQERDTRGDQVPGEHGTPSSCLVGVAFSPSLSLSRVWTDECRRTRRRAAPRTGTTSSASSCPSSCVGRCPARVAAACPLWLTMRFKLGSSGAGEAHTSFFLSSSGARSQWPTQSPADTSGQAADGARTEVERSTTASARWPGGHTTHTGEGTERKGPRLRLRTSNSNVRHERTNDRREATWKAHAGHAKIIRMVSFGWILVQLLNRSNRLAARRLPFCGRCAHTPQARTLERRKSLVATWLEMPHRPRTRTCVRIPESKSRGMKFVWFSACQPGLGSALHCAICWATRHTTSSGEDDGSVQVGAAVR